MRTALVLVVVALAACGDDGNVSIDDAPTVFRDDYCKYLVRCGLVASAAECEHLNIGISLHISASLQAAIDAGKVHYDGALLARCYAAFGNKTCDKTDEDSHGFGGDACRGADPGTVNEGGVCAIDDECKSGMCDVPACPDACCQGTCTGPPVSSDPVALGAACDSANTCSNNAYCDGTTKVCTALKAQSTACLSTNECAFGLGCAGMPRVCEPLPKLGEACPDGTCRDDGNYCNASKICAKLGLPGDPCTVRADCSTFYVCDATMHCASGPHVGESCAVNTRCADADNYCDSTTKLCMPPQADGATCGSNSQCESTNCSGTAGMNTCEPEPVCI